jgi:hypothetical protein
MAKKSSINWVQSTAEIKKLKDALGIEVEDAVINSSQIDVKRSAQNRAREQAIHKEHSDKIFRGMSVGDLIPMLIVRLTSTGYVIISGNHRYDAACMMELMFNMPVHVITCTDIEAEQASRILNEINGLPEKREAVVGYAVDAVVRHGRSVEDAAKSYNMSVPALRFHIKIAKYGQRLSILPPRLQNVVSNKHLAALGVFSNNDNILRAAAEYIQVSKATGQEVAAMARRCRRANTEAEQVEIFRAAALACKELSGRKIPRLKRKKFLTWLTSAENMLKENATWGELELVSEEVPEISNRLKYVQKCLNTLLKVSG